MSKRDPKHDHKFSKTRRVWGEGGPHNLSSYEDFMCEHKGKLFYDVNANQSGRSLSITIMVLELVL